MNNKSYDRITERIVSLLSQGTVPWHKPPCSTNSPQRVFLHRNWGRCI